MSKLEEAIAKLNKKFKAEVVTNEVYVERVFERKISFTTPSLNYSLYGGIPTGILAQIAGGEGGGKTTLCMSICGQAQKKFAKDYEQELSELQALTKPNNAQKARLMELLDNGEKRILWCDAEWTFNPSWAEMNGMDTSKVTFIKPDLQSAEVIFDTIRELAETGAFGLIVLDSIGVLQSAKDLDASYEDLSYGGIAKSLGRFSKDMVQLCAKYDMLFLAVNQLRENLKSTYGGTMTVGGRAFRHNIALAIEVRKGRFIDGSYKELTAHPELANGNMVDVEITKNKVCKPDRRLASFTINYDCGIDYYNDTFNLALALGIIEGTTWYQVSDNEGNPIVDEDGQAVKFQGKAKFLEYMKENEEFTQSLMKRILEGA